MASPLLSLFSGRASRRAVETVIPERTFSDVILPPDTRRALDEALAQVRNHSLIFGKWGLGERHASGLGLAFNFAGPPGTGKTICAEAIAHALGMNLLVVDYAEVESMWMGETPKNVVGAFRAAAEQKAVLFFDEADAIATRRSGGGGLPQEREGNLTVNVLLRELESFNGVVIFATNLAANFDPAFERRIRTHVRFEMPGSEERERIWQVTDPSPQDAHRQRRRFPGPGRALRHERWRHQKRGAQGRRCGRGRAGRRGNPRHPPEAF
jgi:ATPases of the AAA+ class